jgi:hypothetical protein
MKAAPGYAPEAAYFFEQNQTLRSASNALSAPVEK